MTYEAKAKLLSLVANSGRSLPISGVEASMGNRRINLLINWSAISGSSNAMKNQISSRSEDADSESR